MATGDSPHKKRKTQQGDDLIRCCGTSPNFFIEQSILLAKTTYLISESLCFRKQF
jgi:hypothetical protein